jgi:hypothetical protein
MLTQSVVAKESARGAPGPLVLAFGSDIYVYESTGGALLSREQFRADRASGFFEMTAISHIPRSARSTSVPQTTGSIS